MFVFEGYGDDRALILSIHRQRQMCIRDSQGIITAPDKLQGHLVVLIDLLDTLEPSHNLRSDFVTLLKRNPSIDPTAMGFAGGWEQTRFWMT